MPSSGRNWDLLAATFIVVFAGIGTAATSLITSPSFGAGHWIVEPAVQSIRPQIREIHTEAREAAMQVRQELESARQQVRGDLCEMRSEMHEAGRDTARMRDDMRRLRTEIRDGIRSEIRSWFRHSDWR